MFYDTSESIASSFSRLFYTLPVTVPGPIPTPLTTETFPDPPADGKKKKKNAKNAKKKRKRSAVAPVTTVVVGGFKVSIVCMGEKKGVWGCVWPAWKGCVPPATRPTNPLLPGCTGDPSLVRLDEVPWTDIQARQPLPLADPSHTPRPRPATHRRP